MWPCTRGLPPTGRLGALLYQFKFTRGGETISNIERKFKEDLDALDEAAKQAAEFDIHIWQDGHWIARVKKGNAVSNERDRCVDKASARRDALFETAITFLEIRALYDATR